MNCQNGESVLGKVILWTFPSLFHCNSCCYWASSRLLFPEFVIDDLKRPQLIRRTRIISLRSCNSHCDSSRAYEEPWRRDLSKTSYLAVKMSHHFPWRVSFCLLLNSGELIAFSARDDPGHVLDLNLKLNRCNDILWTAKRCRLQKKINWKSRPREHFWFVGNIRLHLFLWLSRRTSW